MVGDRVEGKPHHEARGFGDCLSGGGAQGFCYPRGVFRDASSDNHENGECTFIHTLGLQAFASQGEYVVKGCLDRSAVFVISPRKRRPQGVLALLVRLTTAHQAN